MPEERGGQAWEEVPGPRFAPGTEVAGFTVEGTIASGSFGTVYRARRSGRPYAIKLVPIHPRGDREAAALRLMRHPNVVSFHGYGLWPEEEPRFLVLALELVEGLTLDAWAARENPSALELVMRVLLPFALTLADVHASGVVHRDIKEANIVMREADGQPVLVDFGAAGLKEGALRLTLRLPPGTAEYRSPEALRFARQWEGEPYPFAPGDDLWALGVVLYALLTRTLPFGDRSEPGLNRAILEKTPPAPHALNPRVPLALSELCMGMLEKDPEDRYPDAKALAEDLVELCTQADGDWRTPLFPGGRREKNAAAPAPAVPGHPERWRWRIAGPVAAAVLVLGVFLLLVQRSGSPPALPPQHASPRQELAPAQVTGEVGRGAGPETSPLPAPVASATNSEEPKMKKSQTVRTLVAAGCVASSGCVSGPRQRPPPEPAECPPGAALTHERFGLLKEDYFHGVLFAPRGQGPLVVPVKEGDVTVEIIGPWGKIPDRTTFSGRLYFGTDRVYGRFTKATLPGGEVVPVCLQLRRQHWEFGVPLEPESTRNKFIIRSSVTVERVDSFD
ncbi:serine/threonine-protein kinase [Archangium gephyra]|uniref:Serine/threonine-protein kinase n=1 Tax=Archangium gephyra TaxID=48 RepID=A0AAC8TH55_9BACT|nr:serine/threonine-protein kinase [Archangium gephyra]AKJ05952.1 Serine/threonine protein kinase [Archangium gephyra]REG27295.1 serine/threonine-protein kinase [Archangium gephyra]